MVAHYVIDHGYSPPKPFCDGVIARAQQIIVLDADQVDAINRMDPTECFERCLDIVRRLRFLYTEATELDDFVEVASAIFPLAASGALKRARAGVSFRGTVEGFSFSGLPRELDFIFQFLSWLIHSYPRDPEMVKYMHNQLVDLIEQAKEHGVE